MASTSASTMVTRGCARGSFAGNGAAPHSICGEYLSTKLYIHTPCSVMPIWSEKNGFCGDWKLPKDAPKPRRLSTPYFSDCSRNHWNVWINSGLLAVICRSPSQSFPPNQNTHIGIHQPGCCGS